MKLAMERTGLQQTSRGKMFFILTLLHSRHQLSLFHMQKELETDHLQLWASNSRIAICQMRLLLSLFPE